MPEIDLAKIIAEVQKNPRYAAMDTALVDHVVKEMLKKGFSAKETIKRTRAKLHQVGGAYQEQKIPYAQLTMELTDLPVDIQADEVKTFCTKAMRYHRSTEERLNLLDNTYSAIFTHLPSVKSILDIACGFNPLTLPWLPDAKNMTYYACDVYPQMMEFINAFLMHFNLSGEAFTCDLTQSIPQQKADLAIILKTIPCLEQLDKSIGPRLLNQLNTKAILVSFPVRSLAGRTKDMPRYYEEHFMDITDKTLWNVTKIPALDELFFLLKK